MEQISILIPTYNRRDFLKQCLKSLSFQSYQNFKVIVVDDGSTDGTIDMLKSITEYEIEIHSEAHKGVGATRNKCIECCDTKLAVWQDSDDISNIYRLEELYKAYSANPTAVLNTGWYSYNRGDADRRGDVNWRQIPKEDPLKRTAFATILFEVDKALPFREDVYVGEDTFWRRAMKEKYGNELVLHRQLYYIRWHSERLGVWAKLRQKAGKANVQ